MLRVILLAALIAAVLVLVFAPAAAAECWPSVCCWGFGSTGSGPGQFQGPRGFRIQDPSNETYFVVDSGNGRVQVLRWTDFDSWLTFERQIGRWGSGAGELSNPTGIEIHGSIVYVVDTGNHRIQLFTLDGAYVGQIGHYGQGDGEFDSPQFVAVIDDTLYITDAGNHRVHKLTLGGEYVGQWGTEGTGPGQFLSPSGIAEYPGGAIAVGDRERGDIQDFTASGTWLDTRSAPGVEGIAAGGWEWAGEWPGFQLARGTCNGKTVERPFDLFAGSPWQYIFTDADGDGVFLWWYADPVAPTTWGSLKTRYRD